MHSHSIKVFLFLALLVSVTLISSSNFAYADHDPGHLTVDDPNFVINSEVHYDTVTIQPNGILTITPNGKLTVGPNPIVNDAALTILSTGQLIVEADLSVVPRQNGEVISFGLTLIGTIIIDGTFNEFKGTFVVGPGVILERCGKHESNGTNYQGLAPQLHPDGCSANITEQNNWTLEDDVTGVDYTVEDNHELIITGDTIIRGTIENNNIIRNLSHVEFEGGTIDNIGTAKIIHICQKFEDGSTGNSGFFGSGSFPTSPPIVSFTTCALPIAINDLVGNSFVKTTEDTPLDSSPLSVLDNDSDADFDATPSPTYDKKIVDFLPELTALAGTFPSVKGGEVVMNSDGTFTYDPKGKFGFLKDGVIETDTFTYTLDDGTGGTATAIVTIEIIGVDTPPLITLDGFTTVDVELNIDTYSDAGATALDAEDGDLTSSIVTVNPVVDSTIGTYVITYNVDDLAGNSAVEVIRTVTVEDTTDPVITLVGSTFVDVELNVDTYTELGATVTDNDLATSATATVGGDEVDESIVGTYVVTYNVNDPSDNLATQVIRTVTVEDTTDPVITLVGSTSVSIVQDVDIYAELGATVTDNDPATSATATVGGDEVDESIVGTYVVTYNVVDPSGNSATQVTRTVTVIEESSDSLREQKFEQITILESLIDDSTKKTQKELEKSIKEIQKSLDDKSWIDDSILDSKHGKKVFDHEKHAVKSLMKIEKDDDSTDVSGVIDVLVEVDRTLASDAIDELNTPENEDNDKVQKELEKAEKELEKGDNEAAKGKFDKAIDKYKKAWKHTQHAINSLDDDD